MRPFPVLATLALAILCISPPALAAGEVYKWTDDAGVAQYTDSPPEGRPFQVVKTAGTKPASPAQPAVQAVDPVSGEPIATPPPAAAPVGSAAANCATAQTNVDNLVRSSNVMMDRNGDGVPEQLNDEERKAELERSQSLVKLYCQPEQAAGQAEPAQEG